MTTGSGVREERWRRFLRVLVGAGWVAAEVVEQVLLRRPLHAVDS